MTSTQPGDVYINSILVSGTGYQFDMTANFLSASVIESIFSPGIEADITVIDYQDFMSQLSLQGAETVNFSFTKPNGATANYNFHLNNIDDISVKGAMKSKIYKLVCVSREALTSQATPVQKSYNTQISSIVQDIVNNNYNTQFSLDIEPTQGQRNFLIRSLPANHAIEMLRKEAISNSNKSSNFLFFITQSAIHFKTIEGMFENGDVKTFTESNDVGSSMFNSIDNNILARSVIQNMDAMNRIKAGTLNIQMSTFNVHSNEFVTQQTQPNATSLQSLGNQIISNSAAFLALFPNASRRLLRHVNPNSVYNVGPSYVPDTIPYKMINLAQMTEQLLKMTVIGDPVLEAGTTITNNFPQITASTANIQADPQISGRWLISKLQHLIQSPEIRPRYITNLELLKGAYNT